MEEIMAIIDAHIQTSRYISCLENLSVLFEKHNISFEDRKIILKKISEHNQKLYKLEQSKEKELTGIEVKNYTSTLVVNETKPIELPKKIIEPLNCNVSSYMEKLKEAKTESEIIACLPKNDDKEFDNILGSILVNLYREKVEIINFLNQQENREEIEEVFEEDLDDIEFKIETILDYKDCTDEIELPKTKGNKVVFLKNSTNEPVIFQSLKGYEEYYPSFLELLNSILDGKFKRLRVFTNNAKLTSIMEVKSFKTRILFARLKDNTYVIISAFVKKCDTDLRHRNIIVTASQSYYVQKEQLLECINNLEYMAQEEKYLKELEELLSEKVKVKKNEFNGENK